MHPACGYKWNPKLEDVYLTLLRDAITNGQRVENGWKPQFWDDCILAFRDEGFGVISRQQLENKKDAVCTGFCCVKGPANSSMVEEGLEAVPHFPRGVRVRVRRRYGPYIRR
jgi:Myb/SANT-like DNA-binding domain